MSCYTRKRRILYQKAVFLPDLAQFSMGRGGYPPQTGGTGFAKKVSVKDKGFEDKRQFTK